MSHHTTLKSLQYGITLVLNLNTMRFGNLVLLASLFIASVCAAPIVNIYGASTNVRSAGTEKEAAEPLDWSRGAVDVAVGARDEDSSDYGSPDWKRDNAYSPDWKRDEGYSPDWKRDDNYSPDWKRDVDYSPDWKRDVDYSPDWKRDEAYSPDWKRD
ncbi:hypothetical protein AX17_002017, partial [Amanita inopinata Kibby_2008]